MMHIAELLAFSGPNIWSRIPTIEIRLVADDDAADSSSSLEQICDRIRCWRMDASFLPKTANVQVFRDRLARVKHQADLFAAVVLDLQTLAGTPVEWCHVEMDDASTTAIVAVAYLEEPIARLAVDLAARLVWTRPSEPLPDLKECLRQLRECARQACFGGTTGPIVEAARRRSIPVTRLDGDCLVQLGHGARQRRLMGSLTSRTGYLAEAISRDKSLTKQLLRQLGIPVPPGRLVADAEDAWSAACELGLPVVVKPRDEDCGIGVSLMLKTREQVTSAYSRARECRPDVLVERHLPGTPHRLFVVDDRLIAAVRRDPAQVVGDGRRSVAELVNIANQDGRRGGGLEDPWEPIVVDDEAIRTLGDQQLDLDSVPAPGRLVFLRYDPKMCYGGTLAEVTEHVHPETAAAVIAAVRLTGLDVAGVDVMATDISRPLAVQGGGILELNGGPAIYLHRGPYCHPGRPVAEAIVESLLPDGESGRIPIVAVIGDRDAASAARQAARLLMESGRNVGLATADGVYLDRDQYRPDRADNAQGCHALLLNPGVDLAVCELSQASVRQEGLAFDECQVAMLAAGWTAANSTSLEDSPERCLRSLLDCVAANGTVIANVDDQWLATFVRPGDERLVATALDARHPFLVAHRELGGATAFIQNGQAVMMYGDGVVMRGKLQSAASRETAVGESEISDLLAFAVAASCQLVKVAATDFEEHTSGHRLHARERKLHVQGIQSGHFGL